MLAESCGNMPAVIVLARAVLGVQRCAARSVCSVLGGLLRWRSAAGASTMRSLAGWGLGPRRSQRIGRPRTRREEDWIHLACATWWDGAGMWPRRVAAELVVHCELRRGLGKRLATGPAVRPFSCPRCGSCRLASHVHDAEMDGQRRVSEARFAVPDARKRSQNTSGARMPVTSGATTYSAQLQLRGSSMLSSAEAMMCARLGACFGRPVSHAPLRSLHIHDSLCMLHCPLASPCCARDVSHRHAVVDAASGHRARAGRI